VLVGQFCAAVGFSLISNCQVKLIFAWFAKSSRTLIVALVGFVHLFGLTLGYVLPGVAFDVVNAKNIMFMLFEATLITILALPAIVFMENRPKNPPSFDSEFRVTDIGGSIQRLFKDYTFTLSILSVSLSFGTFLALLGILASVMSCCVEDLPISVSNLGTLALISGVFGILIFVIMVSRREAYKFFLVLQTTFGNVALFLISIYFQSTQDRSDGTLLVLSICFLGLIMIPILPISLIYLEKEFNEYNESIISGILRCTTYLASVIIGISLTFLNTDPENSSAAPETLFICMVLCSISLGILLLI